MPFEVPDSSRTLIADEQSAIDLLILSDTIAPEHKSRIRRTICDAIGEQRIDIILAADDSDPFVALARSTGVPIG